MSYRVTDTDKWNDTWFNTLSPNAKLLFFFLVENCDNAGFYEVSKLVAPEYMVEIEFTAIIAE